MTSTSRMKIFIERIKALKKRTPDDVFVSVIVPFHGAICELEACLNSLAKQSCKNFETIIVSDGIDVEKGVGSSLVNSGVSVRIICNKNQVGPFEARRRGAKLARGEYLWFMDHDDTADINFIEVMLDAAVKTPVEIVECPFLMIPESGEPWVHKKFQREEVINGGRILNSYLLGYSNNSLSNKLIKRKLWKIATSRIGGKNNEMMIFAEDMLNMFFIYLHAKSYRSIESVLYNYHYRSSSTTNSNDPAKLALCLSSLSKVMSKLDFELCRHADRKAVESFCEREVAGALNFLSQRADGKMGQDFDSLVGEIRMKYLRIDSLQTPKV